MPQNRPERPDFFARHRALLEQAVAATAHRGHWTPYPESPSKSLYGEDAAKDGEAVFHERLGGHFELPANPAASATLSDPAFVTGRFATLQSRRPATAEEHTEESAHA
ncbi:hypothetical protein [Streptomyces sp. NBC_01483]|uniref:hypothetical protein n=1 Tax=Streptomyces sp. NBC_01483 TaxID=2903883 RepID=UPI002E2FA336|nr:hypothetical protein [Streptomyces sp. NBC_01483]